MLRGSYVFHDLIRVFSNRRLPERLDHVCWQVDACRRLRNEGTAIARDDEDYISFGHELKQSLPKTTIPTRPLNGNSMDQAAITFQRLQI